MKERERGKGKQPIESESMGWLPLLATEIQFYWEPPEGHFRIVPPEKGEASELIH